MVLVLQSKIVALCQVEVGTGQVKQHFTRRALLQERNSGGGNTLDLNKEDRVGERGEERGAEPHSSSSEEC